LNSYSPKQDRTCYNVYSNNRHFCTNYEISTRQQKNTPFFLNSEKQTGKIIRAEANDAYAIIQYADGKKLKKEFYYGSGYLSCSSRFISIPVTAKSIQLVSYQGKQRIVLF